ncbi:DNA-binding transcriptional regulator, LysR family [Oribacterium sp. KHPX15]|uniref:LysR family transcriptional regulator n=1 Tax=Oribacterium sp. KHPX15 TaxID=1855342 RepID=UPI00089C411E|nr:LysR family transcriptional regulator [Oribacterium sp. KHPX15]SEA91896.1 DNA-binding transcriptional regulator, LysR family [Oribacterium sp. KHPX15]
MDTRQLKYILEIEKAGSISKAAENLFISQSGLNQQLLRIEKELGVTLFDRTTHMLKLTKAGEVVVHYAEDTIHREQRMHDLLDDVLHGDVGTINLNLAMEQGIALFALVFPIFHKQYPNIELCLHDYTVAEQYRLLDEQKLDIGMVMVKHKDRQGIEFIHLRDERLLLGIPSSHALSKDYTMASDGDYPFMDLSECKEEIFSLMFSGSTFREVVDPLFRKAGYAPKILIESRKNNVVGLMSAYGLCLTILPESQAKMYHDINWFRLTDEPTWESCLIYSRNRPPRKAGRDFIDLAVEQAKNIR